HGSRRAGPEHGGAARARDRRHPEGTHGAARPERRRERRREGVRGRGSRPRVDRRGRDQAAPRAGDPRQDGGRPRTFRRSDVTLDAPRSIVEYSRIAEPRLRTFLERKLQALQALPVDLRDVAAALRDYLLRGKRLRGALLVAGHEAAGGQREAALDPSIGVELLHAYLL